MKGGRSNRSHATRVAAIATLLVMACYVIGVLVLNFVVVHRLTTEVDARLAERLAGANRLFLPSQGAKSSPAAVGGPDLDDAPAFVWRVTGSGTVTALSAGAPALPRRSWSTAPITMAVGPTEFRLRAARVGPDWLVAGQSVAEIQHVRSVLWVPELVFGIALLVAVFGGALAIGLRASAPLELVRRRQAAFTADASHELRTPLSVIEAEVDLALSRPRDRETYRTVLLRVAGEGRRLRRIVDDLLWLARADSELAETGTDEASDVAAVASACTERFQAVAETRDVELGFAEEGEGPPTVTAPADWLDRLTGVLVDNACKYAGPGGRVAVRVRAVGNRVGLQVDDSGPGIPVDQRPFIFDRFHRATDSPEGTGLGLAIADSVVRATQGTWSVGRSPLGGARMEVWWRRAAPRRDQSAAPPVRTVDEAGPIGGPEQERKLGPTETQRS